MGGSTNIKHDALTTHEKSEGHKYAVEITVLRNKPLGESSAEKILHSLNKATVSKLEKLFRNAHAVAKSIDLPQIMCGYVNLMNRKVLI